MGKNLGHRCLIICANFHMTPEWDAALIRSWSLYHLNTAIAAALTPGCCHRHRDAGEPAQVAHEEETGATHERDKDGCQQAKAQRVRETHIIYLPSPLTTTPNRSGEA
jgi:hypothetical protein